MIRTLAILALTCLTTAAEARNSSFRVIGTRALDKGVEVELAYDSNWGAPAKTRANSSRVEMSIFAKPPGNSAVRRSQGMQICSLDMTGTNGDGVGRATLLIPHDKLAAVKGKQGKQVYLSGYWRFGDPCRTTSGHIWGYGKEGNSRLVPLTVYAPNKVATATPNSRLGRHRGLATATGGGWRGHRAVLKRTTP